jgi:hypothetical protein
VARSGWWGLEPPFCTALASNEARASGACIYIYIKNSCCFAASHDNYQRDPSVKVTDASVRTNAYTLFVHVLNF